MASGLVSLFTLIAACFFTLLYDPPPVNYVENHEGQTEYYPPYDIPFVHRFVHVSSTVSSTHDFLTTPTNVTFHYVTCGDPTNFPVVFLHGFPDSWAVWRHIMLRVAGADYYTIAFDLKGFGQTSKPLSSILYPDSGNLGGNYTFAFAGDEIVAALQAVGITKFHLVSHDLGSWIGKALAGRWNSRIKSYVLAQTTIAVQSYAEVPQFVWVRRFPNFFIKFLEPRSELLVRSLYGGVKDGYPLSHKRVAVALSDEVIDRAVQEFTPGSIRSWISYHSAISPPYDHFAQELRYFQNYTFPTLLLQGKLDPAQPPHYFDGSVVVSCGYSIWPFSGTFPYGIGCTVTPTEQKDNIWRFSKPLLHQAGDKPAPQYFPNAGIRIFPDLGHFSNIEGPEEFAAEVLDFLANGNTRHKDTPNEHEAHRRKENHDEL